MLQMGFLEIAYNEDRHLKVTPLGKEVLYGRKRAELAVIEREDLRVKSHKERQYKLDKKEETNTEKAENKILFERLRELRKQIAEANHWPAYIVMSDKSLHILATEQPTTLQAFGEVFGIGEYKRDAYGERFIAVIQEFTDTIEETALNMPINSESKATSVLCKNDTHR